MFEERSIYKLRTSGRILTNNAGSGTTGFGEAAFEVVPEPSTLTLAALGMLGLLAYGWRRRSAA